MRLSKAVGNKMLPLYLDPCLQKSATVVEYCNTISLLLLIIWEAYDITFEAEQKYFGTKCIKQSPIAKLPAVTSDLPLLKLFYEPCGSDMSCLPFSSLSWLQMTVHILHTPCNRTLPHMGFFFSHSWESSWPTTKIVIMPAKERGPKGPFVLCIFKDSTHLSMDPGICMGRDLEQATASVLVTK